ncbi:MAG: ABC transporter ATP-binding protein/permease, partial [Oscillospiraceae bacterium]|nr:ABC transporter ATP-binding protein/permease [Oscillospiraceae bacterium]
SAANNLVRIVFAAGVLLTLDWRFGLVFMGAGLFVFASTRFFRPKMKKLHTRVQEREGIVRSFLQETVENLLAVRVFSAERKMLAQNDENQLNMYKSRMRRSVFGISANAGLGLAFGAGYVFALMWGAAGIYEGTMSYGTLTAVLQLVNQIQSPFAGLSSLFPKYFSMCASGERIIALEALPEEKPAEKLLSAEEFKKVVLDNVSFSYGENHVLKDVGIEIEKGDFVSLTGISGGGKSTLFLLLLGAYRPEKGSVSFRSDGGSFAAGRETRPLFAYVPQGNLLFSGTIRENISFLNDGAEESEIYKAAETACAREFIEALPDGMDTRVGENGFGLSEGQAQRIAVARAVLGGAPILLLDEATSALDEQTEARLLKNISKLDGKTVVIVTHRPAALNICTKHLLLKDGNIYERV